MPSCISWRVSHISFAFEQFGTLKYSSIPRTEVIMFLALRLYWILFLSSSVHLSLGFSVVVLVLASTMVGTKIIVSFHLFKTNFFSFHLFITTFKIFKHASKYWSKDTKIIHKNFNAKVRKYGHHAPLMSSMSIMKPKRHPFICKCLT